jgi:hypothetical protein
MAISLIAQIKLAQAVESVKGGWMCECMGSSDMAVGLYEQAVSGFTDCEKALGQAAPSEVAEGLTFCRERLSQLKVSNAISTIASLLGAFLGG